MQPREYCFKFIWQWNQLQKPCLKLTHTSIWKGIQIFVIWWFLVAWLCPNIPLLLEVVTMYNIKRCMPRNNRGEGPIQPKCHKVSCHLSLRFMKLPNYRVTHVGNISAIFSYPLHMKLELNGLRASPHIAHQTLIQRIVKLDNFSWEKRISLYAPRTHYL